MVSMIVLAMLASQPSWHHVAYTKRGTAVASIRPLVGKYATDTKYKAATVSRVWESKIRVFMVYVDCARWAMAFGSVELLKNEDLVPQSLDRESTIGPETAANEILKVICQ